VDISDFMKKVKANIGVFRDKERCYSILTKRPGVKITLICFKNAIWKKIDFQKILRNARITAITLLYIF
jgi:hypothetical protein